MKVIVNGVDYKYIPGSVSISQKLNSRSTAQATILHGTSIHFARGTQVTIKDDYDVTQFYGFISPRESIELDMNTLRTELDCVDAHYLVDKRTITATYTSQAAGTTVSAIITAVLAAEGITAGTIEAGPTLPLLDFKSTKCSSALQDIAEAISFIWWVDSSKKLHFRLPGSQAAPWDLVWENVQAGTLKVIKESPEYKNRVRVRSSASTVSNSATEQTRLAAIESSSGIVEDVLEGPGYGSDTSAQTAADGVITGYAVEETVIEFQTRKPGLAIGQTLTVRLPEHNLDGTAFLIMAVGMHEEHALDTLGAVYSVRAVVGPTSMAWANRISRLVSRGEATARLYDSIVAAPVQAFTVSGVGAVPSGAKMLEYHIFGGGGGAGGGCRYLFSSVGQGGGGGSQGGYTHGVIDASLVGSTYTVVIGAGGTGGSGRSTIQSGSGDNGVAGAQSSFWNFRAQGGTAGDGGAGAAGTTAAKAARAATSHGVTVVGSAPGRGSDGSFGSVPTDQIAQALPCSGASGNGCNAGGTGSDPTVTATWDATYAIWTASRAALSGGVNGADGVTQLVGGQGGSGGKGTQGSGNATNGKNGGFPGGGGGGGGAAASTGSLGSSGNGGNGGAGYVVVIAY